MHSLKWVSGPIRSWVMCMVCLALAMTLSSCAGGGVRKRVFPPSLSVQEMQLQSNNELKLGVRINNFSTVSMHFDHVKFELTLAEKTKIALDQSLDLEIPSESGEVAWLKVPIDAVQWQRLEALKSLPSFAYSVVGKVDSDEPKGRFEIEYESRLSMVPGTTGVFR